MQSDQEVHVCGIFGWNSHSLLHDFIFFTLGYGLFLFFFFSMLLGTDIFLLLFFSIAHILFAIWRVMSKWWSIFVWMKDMFLRNFQCRSQHGYIWSVCNLDHKSMKRILQGKTIWQSSMQNKQHMCEVFKDMSIYGYGRNFMSSKS